MDINELPVDNLNPSILNRDLAFKPGCTWSIITPLKNSEALEKSCTLGNYPPNRLLLDKKGKL